MTGIEVMGHEDYYYSETGTDGWGDVISWMNFEVNRLHFIRYCCIACLFVPCLVYESRLGSVQ